MSLTTTSISAAIVAADLVIPVTSTSSGFPGVGVKGTNQPIGIDGEWMLLDYVIASGLIKVKRRGDQGTYAQDHDILAPLVTSADPLDFPTLFPGSARQRSGIIEPILSIGQNGVIPIPQANTTFILDKATALASTTLAAPTSAQNGLRLTFTSQTAAAHVITATSLLADAVSGSPHTTATFAAFKGASMTLVADAGLWNVVATTGVTIS